MILMCMALLLGLGNMAHQDQEVFFRLRLWILLAHGAGLRALLAYGASNGTGSRHR